MSCWYYSADKKTEQLLFVCKTLVSQMDRKSESPDAAKIVEKLRSGPLHAPSSAPR